MEAKSVMRAKVSAKGWVVIPSELRRRYGLKPGTFVEFEESKDRIMLIPKTRDPVEELYGKLSASESLTRELLEDRAREIDREEAKLRSG